MSSKIPETDWPEIAARRERGEAIASIARSYSCSAALIYNVLARLKARGEPEPTVGGDDSVRSQVATEEHAGIVGASLLPEMSTDREVVRSIAAAENGTPTSFTSADTRPPGITVANNPRVPERVVNNGKPAALTAKLDANLRREVEVAIEAFRTAFDVAVDSTDAQALARLRSAASDMMRMGARTAIVVERFAGASSKVASTPVEQSARSGANAAATDTDPADVSLTTSSADPMTGIVKWFNDAKGFGFVTLYATGTDVFVHAQALERSGIVGLQDGQRVRLTTKPGGKGPQADRIELA